jgi:hypothetical protein
MQSMQATQTAQMEAIQATQTTQQNVMQAMMERLLRS